MLDILYLLPGRYRRFLDFLHVKCATLRLIRINFVLFALVLIVIGAVGCRGTGKFVSPYGKPEPGAAPLVTQLPDVYELLQFRAAEHPLFWARAEVTMKIEGVKGKTRFDATLIYREPDAFRLRGTHPLAGLVFELIASGDQAYVHLAREKELYEGSLEELRRQGGIAGSLSLRDLMGALLVNQDLRRRLEEGRSWKVLAAGDDFFLTETLEDGRTMLWRIRRSDGLVREIVIRSGGGEPELQIVYGGYELINDVEPFPTRLDITVLDGVSRIALKMKEYKTDPNLDPKVVDSLPRSVQSVLPLAILGNQGMALPTE